VKSGTTKSLSQRAILDLYVLIKLYVIARISAEAHSWTDQVCSFLKPPVEAFIPYKHNPWNLAHRKIEPNIYTRDLKAMKEAHIALALPEFGNDCSFEVGWFTNSKIPLLIFTNDQTKWLNDWMTKGGVDVVVTNNKVTYDLLRLDPILKYKRLFSIERLGMLQDIILEIYEDFSRKGAVDGFGEL
jgi:hypothetical protein